MQYGRIQRLANAAVAAAGALLLLASAVYGQEPVVHELQDGPIPVLMPPTTSPRQDYEPAILLCPLCDTAEICDDGASVA